MQIIRYSIYCIAVSMFLGTFCTLAGTRLQSRLVKEYLHLYPTEALLWTMIYTLMIQTNSITHTVILVEVT